MSKQNRKPNQWVSPRDDGSWGVRGEGNLKDTARFRTQSEAISRAIEIAKNKKCEVIIQGEDGKIRSKDSYGNDPCPPRDTEH